MVAKTSDHLVRLFICMTIWEFFIIEDKNKRLEVSARSLLFQLANQKKKIVPAWFAASVAGLIISMQMVIGKIVRIVQMYR